MTYEPRKLSTRNLQYLLLHQFDKCCERALGVTSNARATCKTKGCQLCNNCNILVTIPGRLRRNFACM